MKETKGKSCFHFLSQWSCPMWLPQLKTTEIIEPSGSSLVKATIYRIYINSLSSLSIVVGTTQKQRLKKDDMLAANMRRFIQNKFLFFYSHLEKKGLEAYFLSTQKRRFHCHYYLIIEFHCLKEGKGQGCHIFFPIHGKLQVLLRSNKGGFSYPINKETG